MWTYQTKCWRLSIPAPCTPLDSLPTLMITKTDKCENNLAWMFLNDMEQNLPLCKCMKWFSLLIRSWNRRHTSWCLGRSWISIVRTLILTEMFEKVYIKILYNFEINNVLLRSIFIFVMVQHLRGKIITWICCLVENLLTNDYSLWTNQRS